MAKKLRFKPTITRVKLNPEQAVLSCDCYGLDHRVAAGTYWSNGIAAKFCNGKSNPDILICGNDVPDSGHGSHSAWEYNTGSS
jgi:hypothetical protein